MVTFKKIFEILLEATVEVTFETTMDLIFKTEVKSIKQAVCEISFEVIDHEVKLENIEIKNLI